MKRITAFLVFALCTASSAESYVQPIHRAITEKAFDRLQIDFSARLGVPKEYRSGQRSLQEWMSDGSHDEDLLLRPLNHFFDPAHGSALRVPVSLCISVAARADQWALESVLNSRGLYRARLYYEEAILGSSQASRDSGVKELFLTFGHMIHLVQDMAQPEHTRNDQHLTGTSHFLFNGTEASIWEKWGADNLVERSDPVSGATIAPAVSYDTYPTVRLSSFAAYFHTTDGKGLADFASRNFVTQDTNYHDEQIVGKCLYHTSPRIDQAARRVEKDVRYGILDAFGSPIVITVDEEIYTSFPVDAYLGSQGQDPLHTYHSALDLETQKYGQPVYSLGDGSYLSRASMLIPRAVGYSAGLIEHFFRGSIEVQWKQVASGVYDMLVTNRSIEPIGADAEITAIFRATPAYFGGVSRDTSLIVRDKIAALVAGFDGLEPGESVTIPNVAPLFLQPGDTVTKFERRVLVRAKLGAEHDALIGIVQPALSGGLTVEVTWTCELPNFDVAIHDDTIPPGVRHDHLLRLPVDSPHHRICSDPNQGHHPLNTCIEKSPGGGMASQPVIVSLSPIDPARTYVIAAHSFGGVPVGCSVTWTMSVNGQIKKSTTWTNVIDRLWAFIATAQFP